MSSYNIFHDGKCRYGVPTDFAVYSIYSDKFECICVMQGGTQYKFDIQRFTI